MIAWGGLYKGVGVHILIKKVSLVSGPIFCIVILTQTTIRAFTYTKFIPCMAVLVCRLMSLFFVTLHSIDDCLSLPHHATLSMLPWWK